MSKLIDMNGEAVLGSTASEIVAYLRDTSKFCSHEDIVTFMRNMSKRLQILYNWHVRCANENEFVEDLIEYQWLRLPPTKLSDECCF
jgi:hypothetical protein